MPSLPIVSGAEAVRALERLGFVVARQRDTTDRSPDEAREAAGRTLTLIVKRYNLPE